MNLLPLTIGPSLIALGRNRTLGSSSIQGSEAANLDLPTREREDLKLNAKEERQGYGSKTNIGAGDGV